MAQNWDVGEEGGTLGWDGVGVEWVSQNLDSREQSEEREKAKVSSGGHRSSVTVESIGDTGMVGWGADRKRVGVCVGEGGKDRGRRSSKVVALVKYVLESRRVWRDKVSSE